MEAKLAEIKREKLLEAIQKNAQEVSSMESKLLREEEQERTITLGMIKKDSGLRKMNMGATFLVAPINTCHDTKLNNALESNKSAVSRKLESLMSYYIQREEKKIKGLSEEL